MSTDEEPSPPQYPGHTPAFGRLMEGLGQQGGLAQNTVRAREQTMQDFRDVRADELPMLFRVGIEHYNTQELDLSRRTVAVEMQRRNIEASRQSIQALNELRASVDMLHTTTQAASVRTGEAIGDLKTSIDTLNTSTEKWSKRLTGLTIAIAVLTVVLVGLGVVQIMVATKP